MAGRGEEEKGRAENEWDPIEQIRVGVPSRVVNVASEAGSLAMLSGDFGYPMPYAYCASKAGLNAATVLFALALKKDGIKVNAVSPGLVNTDLSHHMGTRTPAEAAAIVVRFATLDNDGPTIIA